MRDDSQILNIPIEDIIPNRFQPRLNFDESSLQELAASIKEHGIIQPLVLRRLGDKYEIIAGERRYKASKLAGLTKVPAIISEMDDKKSAEVAIVENVQRKDLSAIEEAKSYKALLDKGYLTQDELAKKMGLSQSAISNKLRLLSLAPAVQNALMAGKISERHARSLLKVNDKTEQEKWLDIITTERLTVKELETRLKKVKNTEDTGDERIVEPTPNIDENKEKVDNVEENNEEINIIPNIFATKTSNVPNKFFNFLEDEQANMNMTESVEENEDTEEIELLDFDLEPPKEEVKETIVQDISFANSLVDKTLNELKNANFDVVLEKDDNTNEVKYTLIVKKN